MATISLMSAGGADDHIHVEEDITSQIDGYKLIFITSQQYIPGTLFVNYSGVEYTKDNDFTETDSTHFTFLYDPFLGNSNPFPPRVGFPLTIKYRRVLP